MHTGRLPVALALVAAVMCLAADAHAETGRLSITVSWGHKAAVSALHHVSVDGTEGLVVHSATARGFESDDILRTPTARTSAGKGDVDAIDIVVDYPADAPQTAQHVHVLWTDL